MLGRVFEQKPIRVEAMQFDGNNGDDIEKWSHRNACKIENDEDRDDDPDAQMDLLSSAHSNHVPIYIGDWIVRKDGKYMRVNDITFKENYTEIK